MGNTTVTKNGDIVVVKSGDVTTNNTVVVSQSETSTVNVITLGPKGPPGEITNINLFATTGSNVFIGNQSITGTVTATSFTGSLLGNASTATTALLIGKEEIPNNTPVNTWYPIMTYGIGTTPGLGISTPFSYNFSTKVLTVTASVALNALNAIVNPAGNTTAVQYNGGSSLAGDDTFTFNVSTKKVSVKNLASSGSIQTKSKIRVTTENSPYRVINEDFLILCDTTLGSVTINLEVFDGNSDVDGTILMVKDMGGNALTNPINFINCNIEDGIFNKLDWDKGGIIMIYDYSFNTFLITGKF